MTTRYDLYESPSQDEGKKNIHARIVTDGTVSTEEIAEKIEYGCSLTKGDVEAVLSALSHQIGEILSQGRRVHLDGLGYFQMTLKCPPVKSAKEVRAEAIEFKSVAFRPEKALKEKLQRTRFLRANKRTIHSPKYSEAKIDALLTEYFNTNSYITRPDFEKLFSFTCSTAGVRLNELVNAGKLRKEGLKRSPFYVPENGWYGKQDSTNDTE